MSFDATLGVWLVPFASMFYECLMLMGPGTVIPYLLPAFHDFDVPQRGPCIPFHDDSNLPLNLYPVSSM